MCNIVILNYVNIMYYIIKSYLILSTVLTGAYVGFLVASPLFDTLGRKKVTIGAAILTLITTIAGGFSQNYYLMVSGSCVYCDFNYHSEQQI